MKLGFYGPNAKLRCYGLTSFCLKYWKSTRDYQEIVRVSMITTVGNNSNTTDWDWEMKWKIPPDKKQNKLNLCLFRSPTNGHPFLRWVYLPQKYGTFKHPYKTTHQQNTQQRGRGVKPIQICMMQFFNIIMCSSFLSKTLKMVKLNIISVNLQIIPFQSEPIFFQYSEVQGSIRHHLQSELEEEQCSWDF